MIKRIVFPGTLYAFRAAPALSSTAPPAATLKTAAAAATLRMPMVVALGSTFTGTRFAGSGGMPVPFGITALTTRGLRSGAMRAVGPRLSAVG
jgi:hypothetical protein